MDKKNLPVYDLVIGDEEDGVFANALVQDPANGFGWVAFSKEESTPVMLAMDKMKRNVTGVLLVPGQLIYRSNPARGEHYVQFTKDTIEQIAKDFSRNLRFRNVNLEHAIPTDGAYPVEFWLVGKDGVDKSASLGFKDLPEGTMMITMHIEDDALWQSVLEGTYRGFSIEGMFGAKAIAASIEKQNDPVRAESEGGGYLSIETETLDKMNVKEFVQELTAFLKSEVKAEAPIAPEATTPEPTKLSEETPAVDPAAPSMETRISAIENGFKEISELIKGAFASKTAEVTAMSATIEELKTEVATAKTELTATKEDVTKLASEPAGTIAGQEKKEVKKEIEHAGLKRLLA